MGEVKDNLPQGSSRNKIEYLAEAIDSAKADAKGASAPPRNLLCNPDLTQSTTDWNTTMNTTARDTGYKGARWLTEGCEFANLSASNMHIGKSLGRPAPIGWGIETLLAGADTDSIGLSYYVINPVALYSKKYGNFATGVLADGASGKSKIVMFSMFTTHRDEALYSKDWVAPSDELPEYYSVYFFGQTNQGQRFGIVELDVDGNAKQIVAEKVLTKHSFDEHERQWIHGIELDPSQAYAYFVESDSADNSRHSNGKSALIIEAGVFINYEKLDVVPDMTPQPTRMHKCTEVIGTFPASEVATGKLVPMKQYHTPYGMEKHWVFAYTQGKQRSHAFNQLSVTKHDEHHIRVQGVAQDGHTSVDLSAFYSETPLYINFSNVLAGV
ncbi:hypothetical protein INR79_09715 [Vibrio sp. SCSIO 43132]|uniref:hypothetical protein n=1 Tax=Vibrio sp. SCSIO 43132 TaxID=2779363 RepID=UPI001CA9A845|nr:hypothetical protein [Vibrio sp. SCSIO 43132]UAB68824.1 hypothetical protein INR79_09715 [Vibrio sp. SCSIO 43132]